MCMSTWSCQSWLAFFASPCWTELCPCTFLPCHLFIEIISFFFILIQCPLWVSSNHRNRGVGLLVHTYIYVYAFSRNFFIQIDLQRRINIQATQRNSLLCSVGLYSLLLNFPLLCFFLCVLPTFLYTDFICSLVPFYLNGIDWFLSSFYVKYN